MTQIEESAAAGTTPGPAATGISGATVVFTPERLQEALAALKEPFDPQVVKWRVTNTTRDRKRGQVAAYADPRVYGDRLNALFTPAGWTQAYDVQTVQNFEVPNKSGNGTIITAKVMVTAKVTIHGLGTHSGTGEELAIDENALTIAEAQAFKRACSWFGLGRYFYDVTPVWVPLDDNKQPLQLPKLPDWALPKGARGASSAQNGSGKPSSNGSRSNGTTVNGNGSGNTSTGTSSGGSNHQRNGRRNGGLYGAELRKVVDRLANEVGFGLARWVARLVAGKEEIRAIRSNAHLTSAMEKLTDLARGVGRLRAAREKAGEQIYSTLCQELNLASDSVDDITDRRVLEALVKAMEGAAAAVSSEAGSKVDGSKAANSDESNGSGGAASTAPQSTGSNRASIAQLRERLLVEARRVSTARKRGIGDVIALATKGSFGFADLTKLTEADASKVEAALAELARMTA